MHVSENILLSHSCSVIYAVCQGKETSFVFSFVKILLAWTIHYNAKVININQFTNL